MSVIQRSSATVRTSLSTSRVWRHVVCASVVALTVVLVATPAVANAAMTGWTERALGSRVTSSDFITATHGWIVTQTYASDSGGNAGGNTATNPGTDPGTDPGGDPDMMALAYSYSLRETTDGGASWTNRSLPAGLEPSSIAFGDATHGWLVGVAYDAKYNETGYIYGTSDGGATWKLQATGITGRNSDIDAVDATHAYTFKDDVISGTSDGSTWTNRSSGLSSRYESLHVSSAGHVWLGGVSFSGTTGSVIVASKDGGTTWTKLANPGRGKLWAIYAYDANNVWTAGYEASTFLRSTNGGASWTSLPTPPLRDVFSIAFNSPTHGWMSTGSASDGKHLFETNDGGATWTGYVTTGKAAMMPLWAPDATHVLAIAGYPTSALWTWSGSGGGGGGGGTVLGKAALKITAPASAKRNKVFSVTGSIAPKHTPRTIAVKVVCTLKVGARTVTKAFSAVAVGSSGAFKASIVLPTKGRWKVVATHKDAGHAATTSAAKYVTVN